MPQELSQWASFTLNMRHGTLGLEVEEGKNQGVHEQSDGLAADANEQSRSAFSSSIQHPGQSIKEHSNASHLARQKICACRSTVYLPIRCGYRISLGGDLEQRTTTQPMTATLHLGNMGNMFGLHHSGAAHDKTTCSSLLGRLQFRGIPSSTESYLMSFHSFACAKANILLNH